MESAQVCDLGVRPWCGDAGVGIGVATGAKLKTKSETVSIDPYPDSVEREPDSESAIAA